MSDTNHSEWGYEIDSSIGATFEKLHLRWICVLSILIRMIWGGVATVSRIDKIICLFCRTSSLYRALLQKRPVILSILLTKATRFQYRGDFWEIAPALVCGRSDAMLWRLRRARMHTSACTHMHTHISLHTHTPASAYTHTHTHQPAHTHTHAVVCSSSDAMLCRCSERSCTHLPTHTHTHTYTSAYAHKHTHTSLHAHSLHIHTH